MNLGVANATVLLDDERDDDASLSASLLSSLGIFHGHGQEFHQLAYATRELRHLLHHIERTFGLRGIHRDYRDDGLSRILLHNNSFLVFVGLFSRHDLNGVRVGCLRILYLNGLDSHLDFAVLTAFLHHFLLWRLGRVVHVVIDGLGIQSQSNTHDGDECEQLEPARTIGFLIGKHHVYAVFEGTVTDTVGHRVPAVADGFLDKQILILAHIDALREYRCVGLVLMDGAQVLAQHPHSRIEPLQSGERINEEQVHRVVPTDVSPFMGENGGVHCLVVAGREYDVVHPTEG